MSAVYSPERQWMQCPKTYSYEYVDPWVIGYRHLQATKGSHIQQSKPLGVLLGHFETLRR